MADVTHQWLGARPRYTLWEVHADPFAAYYRGCVREEPNGMWTAYLAPGRNNADDARLRTCDDLTAACRTLCARLRVECPQVPMWADDE